MSRNISNTLLYYRHCCTPTQLPTHLIRHGNPLAIDKRKDLVIIHDRVHGLNPQCVHWSVKHQPLLVGLLIGTSLSHDTGQHTICPLARVQVKLTIEFSKRQCLRVDGEILQRTD